MQYNASGSPAQDTTFNSCKDPSNDPRIETKTFVPVPLQWLELFSGSRPSLFVLIAIASRTDGAISKAEISRLSGVHPTTVWKVITELAAAQIVKIERSDGLPNRYLIADRYRPEPRSELQMGGDESRQEARSQIELGSVESRNFGQNHPAVKSERVDSADTVEILASSIETISPGSNLENISSSLSQSSLAESPLLIETAVATKKKRTAKNPPSIDERAVVWALVQSLRRRFNDPPNPQTDRAWEARELATARKLLDGSRTVDAIKAAIVHLEHHEYWSRGDRFMSLRVVLNKWPEIRSSLSGEKKEMPLVTTIVGGRQSAFEIKHAVAPHAGMSMQERILAARNARAS